MMMMILTPLHMCSIPVLSLFFQMLTIFALLCYVFFTSCYVYSLVQPWSWWF